MPLEAAKIGVQAATGSFGAAKDLFLYMDGMRSNVKHLDDNLTELVMEMVNIKSRKRQIDQNLKASVFKEQTGEYHMLVKNIESFEAKSKEFLNNYLKHRGNVARLLLKEPDVSILSKELDASFASDLVNALKNRKSTMWTFKFRKFATLSKRIKKLRERVSQLNKELEEKYMVIMKELEDVSVKYGGMCDLPRQDGDVKRIRIYLNRRDVKIICIWGCEGMGKTTVLKKLYNQLNDEKVFVIYIVCPIGLDTEEKMVSGIQEKIMEQLNIDNTLKIQKRRIISEFLSQRKYYLLIDQAYSYISLDDVGICDDHEHRKIVVAASNKLAISEMEIDAEVKINPLPEKDALTLLESICGPIHDPRIKVIANEIVKCCGGLPLAVKSIANKSLKGKKDEKIWQNVKTVLQSNTGRDSLGLAGIGNFYEMMYKQLEGNYKKKCAVYGILFPSQHKICKDALLECWKAEGFFYDQINIAKLRRVRQRGVVVLNELTDRYLLNACSDKHVEMPIHFRKIALAKSHELNTKMWVAGPTNELPTDKNWAKTRRMSLVGILSSRPHVEGTSESANIWSNLPECPKCSNISTLLMQLNPKLQRLEDGFFTCMESLQVLDLHQTQIRSLPSSIKHLKNLECLYLHECDRLDQLPPEMDKLSKLEVLDIRKTLINPWLPKQIGSMVRLRCLRVSFDYKGCNSTWNGKEEEAVNPSEIIKNLEDLEEFTIETMVGNASWMSVADEIASVLANLKNLTTLNFNFPTVESLQNFIHNSWSWNNTNTDWKTNTFSSFKFFVGCEEVTNLFGSDICGLSAERHLTLSSSNENAASVVLEVIKQTSSFEFIGHPCVKNLNVFNLGSMGSLKVCVIGECRSIETIVDAYKLNGMSNGDGGILQSLEKLLLYDLESLQNIWRGTLLPNSFSSLIVLKVWNCPKLTEINAEIWTLLEEIQIKGCKNLIKLSLTRKNARHLTSILCEASWWRRLELQDDDKSYFAPMCHFIAQKEEQIAFKVIAGGESSRTTMPYSPEKSNIDVSNMEATDNEITEVSAEKLSEKEMERNGKSCFPCLSNNLLKGSQTMKKQEVSTSEEGENGICNATFDNAEQETSKFTNATSTMVKGKRFARVRNTEILPEGLVSSS